MRDGPVQQQGGFPPPLRTDEMSENSIFLAVIPGIREQLDMHRAPDPVLVVSSFLRRLEIHTGMDNLAVAGNAVQTRTQAVINRMRSNLHKAGAMGVPRRELGTAEAC